MSGDADSPGSRLRSLRSRVRFGKFVSVGIIGAVCDTAVLLVLVEVFGLLEEVAVLIGIETAIVVMFLLNDSWTFAGEGRSEGRSFWFRLGRSHLVRAGGTVTQFLVFIGIFRLFFVSVTVFGIDAWLLVAKGAGIAAGMIVNYVFESLFTWQVHVDT